MTELYTINADGSHQKTIVDIEQGNHYHIIEHMQMMGWKLVEWSADKKLYLFRADNGDVGIISC